MKNYIIIGIALALIIFVHNTSAKTISKPVHIVYIEPVGEIFTQQEQEQTYSYVENAIQYWQTLSPITTTLSIVDTEFLTTTEDVLEYPGLASYLNNKVRISDTEVYLYIIDNSNSLRFISQDNDGLADYYSIWVTTSSLDSTYAHEFGHNLYNLPHQFQESIDIMGLYPKAAFDRHTIGCASLQELGSKCHIILLPIVSRQ